jgi:hypothetical protein
MPVQRHTTAMPASACSQSTDPSAPAPPFSRSGPQYGSLEFFEQHDWIVQLNVQAHHNVLSHSDEFVMEALVSRSKVDMLVHSLLVAEVGRGLTAWGQRGPGCEQ